MTQDYYELDFITRDVDTTPIAPSLAAFFDDVLQDSVSKLNFRAIVDGLGEVLFQFPFKVPGGSNHRCYAGAEYAPAAGGPSEAPGSSSTLG